MKLLYLLLLIALTRAQDAADIGASAIDPCKEAYDKCELKWVERTKDLMGSAEKCESAEKWSACIVKAVNDQACNGQEGTPEALVQEQEIHCGQSEDCKDARKKCRNKYEAVSKGSDTCAAITEWLECNKKAQLTGKCTDIPQEIYEEKKKSCESAEEDAQCKAAVKECSQEWEVSYDAGLPNALKCKLAEDWDRCLKSAAASESCQTSSVDTPAQVRQQLGFCNVPDVVVDLCEEGTDLCRDTWANSVRAARTSDKRCSAATSWRDCLESETFLDDCPSGAEIPVEVQETMLYHCTPAKEDADSCSGMEDECARRFLVSRDANSDKCKSFKEWEKCLKEAKAAGCGIAFPTDLEQNLELCENEDGCTERMASCKVEYDNQDATQDRCQQARTWRSCLVELFDVCDGQIVFPQELNTLEANSCYLRGSSQCLSEQTKCKKTYQDNAALSGSSCVYVKQWRQCLMNLVQSCSDMVMPMELNIEEANNCYGKQADSSSCTNQQATCKKEFDDGLPSADDKCAHVRKWRSCLEGLMNKCTIEFPMELNSAEAGACYAQGRSSASGASDDKDAGGAKLSCEDRKNRCKRSAVISNRRKSNRCDQAKEWRSCIEGLIRDGCTDLTFPMQLNQLEANSCYSGQPASSDDDDDDKKKKKEEKDSSCKKKIQKCKPSRPSNCNHALAWRGCLEKLMSRCGNDIFPQELNTLQAFKC